MIEKSQAMIYPGLNIRKFLTFDVDSYVSEFVSIENSDQLMMAISKSQYPLYILGGGSNLIPPPQWDVSLLKNDIGGIEVVKENSDDVFLRVGGGVNWHQFVLWTLKQEYYGLENLSLIPGTVGASPVQNIGAYGVEIVDHFYSLEGVNLQDGSRSVMRKDECEFAYRNSIFKNELKGTFFITHVTFQLSKSPQLCIEYGAIRERLKVGKFKSPTPQDISQIVVDIRNEKLPDPARIPNCGSFFKNPIVPVNQVNELKKKYPQMPSYVVNEASHKVPAGWLIEQAGLKGKSRNGIGSYKNQALVIVNLGNGSYNDLIAWASHVQKTVENKYGISLEREVNVIL